MQRALKAGDRVKVMDEGLLMLQKFSPPDAKPNNEGVITEICSDGTAMIEFPIGDDNPEEHSQSAPYPIQILQRI